MTRIFIKPALDKSAQQDEGQTATRLKVRKPVGGHLKDEGEWQNQDSYWLRRLADGDVEGAVGPSEEEPAALSAADTGARAGSSKSK